MKNKLHLWVKSWFAGRIPSAVAPWLPAVFTFLLIATAIFWWPTPLENKPESSPGYTADVRVLRLGLNIAADSALHAAAQRFAELVGERSGGKLKVSVFPDQQLGNDEQMLEMASNGQLDLLLTPTAKLSSAIPAMQYADLPFYFSGREELYSMLDGEPGQMLLSKLSTIGLVGLTFWENGFKQFTANTPIRTPRDFSGLRMRTMKSRIIVDQFESLGAKAIPIDFHVTYKALADGAVDGQENPLVAIVGMRFHKVQKHLTISNHAYLAYAFSASKKIFETLSPEMRDIIQRTASELTPLEREDTARREASFIETIRAEGVVIHTLSADERRQFTAAMAPLADKFGFEVGYDLLAKTEELRFKKKQLAQGARTKQPLLIGIDADLSGASAQAGGAILRGVQLALEEINKKGGLLGRSLRMIALDNKGNPQIGRTNLEYFAAMPSLLAVVGGVHTPVIMDEIADIQRLHIPFLVPWAAGQELTRNGPQSYLFRVSVNDSQVMQFLLSRALKQGGKVGIMLEQSAWGRSNEAVLKPLISGLPPGSVRIEWVYAGDPNVESKLKALIRDGMDSLIMACDTSKSRSVVQAMASQEKPVPIFSHWGVTSSNFWKLEQAALQRVELKFMQPILLEEKQAHPQLRAFVSRYRERYGLGGEDVIMSPAGSVHAYDLVHLLARSVAQANTTDRKIIRVTLEKLQPYRGVMRNYAPAFTKERHDALEGLPLHLARFGERGRIVKAD